MAKIINVLFICALFPMFSITTAFSQTTEIDSLKNLINALSEDRDEKMAELEVEYKLTKKETELENAVLKNKLQDQQLAEADFQLIAILFISIITVAFIITFYFLKSKRTIAEREAQELQIEAIEKRLLEIKLKYEGIEKTIDISQINKELITPLTEREIETLQLSLDGLPNNEIAEKSFESINTIKFHLRKIYQKLGESNLG